MNVTRMVYVLDEMLLALITKVETALTSPEAITALTQARLSHPHLPLLQTLPSLFSGNLLSGLYTNNNPNNPNNPIPDTTRLSDFPATTSSPPVANTVNNPTSDTSTNRNGDNIWQDEEQLWSVNHERLLASQASAEMYQLLSPPHQ